MNKEEKTIFYVSMLFLLLVTITLISATSYISKQTYQNGEIRLAPDKNKTDQPSLLEFRTGYLFIIFSITALFFILIYNVVKWPKKTG